MKKQLYLYEDEMTRSFLRLKDLPWIQLIQRTPLDAFIVTTTDGQVWNVDSPLNFVRLLYYYERDTN